MLRIHLRHHCNEIIAITTVGYTIPIRASCIHNIISMDTRHPLPVMSGFRHNASSRENHAFKSNAQINPQSAKPISAQPAPYLFVSPERETNTRLPYEGMSPRQGFIHPTAPKSRQINESVAQKRRKPPGFSRGGLRIRLFSIDACATASAPHPGYQDSANHFGDIQSARILV